MEDEGADNLSKKAFDLDAVEARSKTLPSAPTEEGRRVWRGGESSLCSEERIENGAPTFESGSRDESQESSWYGENTRSLQSSSERSEFLLEPDDLGASSRLSSAENRASEVEEEEEEEEGALRPKSRIRRSTALGIEGVARIDLSPLTQKIVGCVIGENVTTEYPWIYVKKETIEDNIDLHDESSDFLPIKDAVLEFPDAKMLVGYAPSSLEEGQFYVCLTKSARDAVIRGINALRCEQEDRVRNAIYKTVGKWDSLGSEAEVNDSIVRNTRPLFEIEIVRPGDSLNLPFEFTDRGASDQRDGYAEILPYRQTFEHATMKLVGRGEQAMPETRDNEAQTDHAVLVNAWTRYEYVYPAINTEAYNYGEAAAMKVILDRYTDNICDEVTINETWDIYANDYANLVRSYKDTIPPEVIVYAEHQSYSGGKLCKDRVVNSLSWHPYWSGVAAVAYTNHAKMETLNRRTKQDEVMRACHESNHVLIWSFTDCLRPKLVLESPREVTVISFCPLDGNVIIGGCANGQIAIWDVAGKIEEVETVVVRTPAQGRYEVAMRNLMWWTQEARESAALRPDAMSTLQHGHSAAITEISWVPAYNKMDKNGRIARLRAETPVDELTWQFVTTCEDGTVAFWDLKSKPRDTSVGQLRSRRRKRVPRPEALIQATSPYKRLDRLLKPDYKISVRLPGDNVTCLLPLTCANNYFPDFRLVRIQPEPEPRKDLATRLHYRHAIEAPDYEMEPSLLVGSVDGHLLRITWDGYEFSTGLTINDEVARVVDRSRIHDGPVTAIVRSKYSKNVLITIGGKIFALWQEDKMVPVLWRRSTFKYTAGCWGSVRPTVILMARSDGSIEVWDLRIDSKVPVLVQSVSGRPITGIVIHKLPIPVPCIAFFDYNGILRVCTAPESMLRFDTADIEWFEDFCNREIERIEEFRAWQKEWSSTNNAERLKRQRILGEIDAEKERQARLDEIQQEMDNEGRAGSEKEIREPGAFLRKAHERWKSMELRRMHRVILDKKGLLSRADLENRRTPLTAMREETRRKEKKMRDILKLQNSIFQNAVAFLFPDQYNQQDATTEMTLAKETDRLAENSKEQLDSDVARVLPAESQPQFATTDEELVYRFLETQAEALAVIHGNPYRHTFVWRRVLADGRRRRTAMDPMFARRTRHRRLYVTDVYAEPPRRNIAWFDEESNQPEIGEVSRAEEGSEDYDVVEESAGNSSAFDYFNEANKSPSRR